MVLGARGPCGQRVQPVAVRVLRSESDRVTVLLPKMAGSRATVLKVKWETAVIDRAQVATYMLFTGREVRIGKNCARGLEYGPRPQAEGRTQDQGHSFSLYGPT